MEKPKELFRIQLKTDDMVISSTGKTRHYNNGILQDEPVALSIVQYPNDDGYYLFYLDESYTEQNDTYHENLKKAFQQAEFEFNVKPEDWDKVSN